MLFYPRIPLLMSITLISGYLAGYAWLFGAVTVNALAVRLLVKQVGKRQRHYIWIGLTVIIALLAGRYGAALMRYVASDLTYVAVLLVGVAELLLVRMGSTALSIWNVTPTNMTPFYMAGAVGAGLIVVKLVFAIFGRAARLGRLAMFIVRLQLYGGSIKLTLWLANPNPVVLPGWAATLLTWGHRLRSRLSPNGAKGPLPQDRPDFPPDPTPGPACGPGPEQSEQPKATQGLNEPVASGPVISDEARAAGVVLGLQVGVSLTQDEITASYRRLAARNHPDKFGPELTDVQTAKMQDINNAREELIRFMAYG